MLMIGIIETASLDELQISNVEYLFHIGSPDCRRDSPLCWLQQSAAMTGTRGHRTAGNRGQQLLSEAGILTVIVDTLATAATDILLMFVLCTADNFGTIQTNKLVCSDQTVLCS